MHYTELHSPDQHIYSGINLVLFYVFIPWFIFMSVSNVGNSAFFERNDIILKGPRVQHFL